MAVGKVVITLDEFRKAKGISKYQIIQNCRVSHTQLNNYCNNKVERIDLPVLARICGFLECDIGDILRYVPENED
ncbi:MAG: helix-turn-helix transcriptional regulator [Ruminococcus sp.]|nr:helix-turn-helix transcriptional regulator [Ruminococcus sp.]